MTLESTFWTSYHNSHNRSVSWPSTRKTIKDRLPLEHHIIMKFHSSTLVAVLGFLHALTVTNSEDIPTAACDPLVASKGVPNNATSIDKFVTTIDRLNGYSSTFLSQIVEKAGANNASKVDIFLCTYKAAATLGGSTTTVVTSGAVCSSGTADCEAFAEYYNQTCPQASVCYNNPSPSFNANCSGLSTSYPTCQLTCAFDEPGSAFGMDTCFKTAGPAPGPAPSPSPTRPTSAAMGHMGAGLVLSGLLTLASLTLC